MLVKNKELWQVILITIVLVKMTYANSAEIQAFGYLGYEGQLNLDYLFEKNFVTAEEAIPDPAKPKETRGYKTSSTNDERIVKQANLDLLFHTFIYHPNFLKFDIGLGLVQTQSSVEINQVVKDDPRPATRNTSDSSALDFNLLLSFFEKKDYPFSVFYSKKTPPLTSASTDAFISKNVRYGAKFLWNAPVIINVDAIHFDTKGDSNLRIIQEDVDSTSFRAYKLFKENGYQQFSFNHQVARSKSGSFDDNIIERLNITDDANYTTQMSFGESEQFDFSLNVNYKQNRKSFEFNDISVVPEFKWSHSDRLKSYYQLSYKINEFQKYKIENQIILAGLSYTNLEGISNVINISANRTELPKATSAQNDLRDSISYITRFSGGSLSVSGLVSVTQNESRTESGGSVKQNETFTLTNNEQQFRYSNVEKSKDKFTIVVTSLDRRPGFVYSTTDYQVINRNGVATIRLRPEPSLIGGDRVQVTYFYNPGQDNAYQTVTSTLSSHLNFFDYYNSFAGITKYNLKLQEGTLAATQVTERITNYYGAGVDYPIYGDDIIVGGELRRENTEENITSIRSSTDTVYSQFRLFRSASLYISRRRVVSDYSGIVGQENDVDRVSYHVLLKIQPTHRTNLSLTYDDSRDVGSILRRYTESALKYEWHYRRILFKLTGSLLKDKQGTQRRERTAIHLNLIRTF